MTSQKRLDLWTPWVLPTPLPDELAYSVIARYLRGWNGLDPRGLLSQVVGFRLLRSQPLAAPGISRLAHLTSHAASDWNAGARTLDFAHLHTMWPYYAAFSSVAQRDRLESSLLEKRHAVASLAYRPSLRLHQPTQLAYCPACMVADRAEHAEAYWHRAHQLAGVSACHLHGLRLLRSSIGHAPDGALGFATVADASTPIDKSRRTVWRTLSPALEDSVRPASIELLTKPRSFRANHYRELVAQVGYRGRSSEMRATEFATDFTKWLKARCLRPSALGRPGWWLCMTTKVRGLGTPLQHLVLRSFLAEQVGERNGRAPWLLDHYFDDVPVLAAPGRHHVAVQAHQLEMTNAL